MADINRQNELIRIALNGKREECKNDEERQFYDDVVKQAARAKKWGLGMDLVHESTD
jgi:hypothetical protein